MPTASGSSGYSPTLDAFVEPLGLSVMESIGYLWLQFPRSAAEGGLEVGQQLSLQQLGNPPHTRWALQGNGCGSQRSFLFSAPSQLEEQFK